MIARIVTPWDGDGKTAETSFHPRLIITHPLPIGAMHADITHQPGTNLPPSPNAHVVQVYGITPDWLAVVRSDPAFVILWDNEARFPDEFPSAVERLTLHDQLVTAGFTDAHVIEAIGVGSVPQTRVQLEQLLTLWLASRPKG